MKRVLILQHVTSDGPAYLGTWLRARGALVDTRDTQRRQPFPDRIDGYAALAVLGGPMSANDPLPSLRQAEQLILQAMALGVPVLGHCLGGQLMARALGARVGASPAPEIGFQVMEVLDHPLARTWFGESPRHTVMHWHYEAFDLPPGATALARSPACPHQAFAIGPHLGMQFHIEIDAPKLDTWLSEVDPSWERAQGHHASVQDRRSMQETASACLPAHHRLADRIFERWWGSSR